MQMISSELSVLPLEQTSFSLEDVFVLIQEVYKERVDAGIDFTLSKITFEEYKNIIQKEKKRVFVIPNEGRLIGSAALAIRKDSFGRKYGGFSNAVVLKEYQGKGLGTKLFETRKREAIKEGCEYLYSSTAENAVSSIRWHKKNGWHLYGYGKQYGSKYFSCFFKYPLKKRVTALTRFAYCLLYFSRFVFIRCLFRKDGGYTVLGKLIYTKWKRRKKQN